MVALTHGVTPKPAPSLLFAQAAGRRVIRVLPLSLQEPGELRPARSVPPTGNPRPRAQAHPGCAGSGARAPSQTPAPPDTQPGGLRRPGSCSWGAWPSSNAVRQGLESSLLSGQRPRPPSLRSQPSWAQAPWGECVTVPHGGRRASHPFPTMQVGSRETCCLWWVRKLRPGAQVSRRQMQSCYGRARLGPAWGGQGRGGVAGAWSRQGRGRDRGAWPDQGRHGWGGGHGSGQRGVVWTGGVVRPGEARWGRAGVAGAEGRGQVRGGVARSGERGRRQGDRQTLLPRGRLCSGFWMPEGPHITEARSRGTLACGGRGESC